MHPLRQSAWLFAVLVGLWLVLALPAQWVGGTAGLEGLTWAVGLCLVPGLVVLSVAVLLPNLTTTPQAILLSTTLRMLMVLSGALLIREVRPELGFREFFAWLIVSYLTALAMESYFLVSQQHAAANPTSGQN
ncbi:MAG TPA: hypothetical protein DCE47_12245 [Planctomycetaceae bacterium]|nr:hypothetical protein [Planctomycetaceae bacterium]HCD00323.1 hypothetical protein [Planctomycetaceae bacterium]|tara:strand:+ start:790 stop:1188 length:399 start_codon:yes stop_codon:yes gene_type:complete